jgi:hypothetical protein
VKQGQIRRAGSLQASHNTGSLKSSGSGDTATI